MAKKRPANNNRPATPPASSFATGKVVTAKSKRELIFVRQASLQQFDSRSLNAIAPSSSSLSQLLSSPDVQIRPLFGASEERVRSRTASMAASPGIGSMDTYYHVDAPDEKLDELANELLQLDEIQAAYVKPAGEPPVLNVMQPSAIQPPTTTPDFSSRQGYLCPAPEGVNAYYAWRFLGGRGNGIRIIDCEWGWEFGHEDLWRNQGGIVIGSNYTDTNHGTAVLGEFSGDKSGYGIIGICSDACASAASFLTLPTADVIRQAADRLGPGDIILLEIHRPGPGAGGFGQDGYIAIEWWPDDFAAIQYAVARGIIVVEAAGNGARDLDNPIYNTPATGFPATWSNPFNLANPQSGAVLVGAGAPPPGTHGRDHGPDRSRLDFSNFGSRVDAQGWGREVTTTGYGDLQGGSDPNLWYTDQFSGTSSASPIVVGTLGSIQGILKANHRPLLTSPTAAQLLRSTGSPQQDEPSRPRSQRIGNRPDIKQMVGWLFGVTPEAEIKTVEQTETVGDGKIELNLSGKITINVRSADVTINVTDSSSKPANQNSQSQG